MKSPPKKPARIQQPTPLELRNEILSFIQRKFYPDDRSGSFYKDRQNLLRWVVLKPAVWLDEKGVTINTTAYREILVEKILMEALRHGATDSIKYIPAWLGKCVDSHLSIHGEKYYEAAKSFRSTIEQTLLLTQQRQQPAQNPIQQLAAAAALIRPSRRPKARLNPSQPDLFPGL